MLIILTKYKYLNKYKKKIENLIVKNNNKNEKQTKIELQLKQ